MEHYPISGSNYISDADLTEQFVRSSGPGGQNVNKVSTAVLLRFDLMHCETLSPYIKSRAAELAGSRLTKSQPAAEVSQTDPPDFGIEETPAGAQSQARNGQTGAEEAKFRLRACLPLPNPAI